MPAKTTARKATAAKKAPAKRTSTPRVRKAPAVELGALTRTCTGPSVAQLRTALLALGYDALVDGDQYDVYDAVLDQAVLDFQAAHDLPLGVADTATLEAVNKETR
jgi:peptidoglycan hydrolase-like protein with peptidoglycan-binding domain